MVWPFLNPVLESIIKPNALVTFKSTRWFCLQLTVALNAPLLGFGVTENLSEDVSVDTDVTGL